VSGRPPASTARERVARALDEADGRAELGAFWALDREGALSAAGAVAAAGPLAGMPVAVKDLFDQAGLPTTAGLPGPVPPARTDAAAVARLRGAGAIPIGKTAMDPLGCTTGGQAPGFAPCLNPVDPALSPGGSSSGSAVAVAAGMVPLALGSDTAGSARIPAAYCGTIGFKPTLDCFPREGVVAVMPAFDTPALLADSVARCAEGYSVLSAEPPPAPLGRQPVVALLGDLLDESDPAVAGACRAAVAELAGDGAAVEEVRLDWRPQGFGVALAHELAATWSERVDREPDRFPAVIRETIAFGLANGPHVYRDVMSRLRADRRALARRFAGFDAVVCPTVPIPAPAREDESVRVSTRFTRIFNALDWPAMSIPVRAAGVTPVAVQVVAPLRRGRQLGRDRRLAGLFEVARRLERGGG
jgi:aspartyl-tRNA(Asn)/glutamyl-tRNA(Gln) amidotransferase subunit A